eukprot:TRINITY_DN11521_c0_g1_i1.p2 TRINITY_DN11521_c0_g1~~TRINITY_DN11521_c0_g1_i1.p2  ORF type:complete len:112 (-),score=28.51 TRINITY_DN11521_c0_g1_i1:79-414(-)
MTMEYPISCDKVKVRCKSTDLEFNVRLLNKRGYRRGVACLHQHCQQEFHEQGLEALLQEQELPHTGFDRMQDQSLLHFLVLGAFAATAVALLALRTVSRTGGQQFLGQPAE